ncbi:MAG: SRPBCC family protein [Anaerolineae bacterium]
MATFEHTINVNVPVHLVYHQWTQFEELPRFMEGIAWIQQLGPDHLRWRAEIAGDTQEWNAVVTVRTPNQCLSWASVSAVELNVMVTFQPVAEDVTRIVYCVQYMPRGLMEKVGTALGVVDQRMAQDLARFKHWMEEQHIATQAWLMDEALAV